MRDGCLSENELLEFTGGRLSADGLADLEAHLDACADCRAALAAARRSTVGPAIDDTLPGPRAARVEAAGTTFSAGDRIAGRYRIVELVGRGGMGEVYRAFDTVLGEPVALKTLRASVADDADLVERAKREVQLARKVTHDNVCRIFDWGAHGRPRPDGSSDEITFLTMELLDGETLRQRLRRSGRLTTAEAFPLFVQMAAGLTAAHRAGVVHRDFKSDNVLLVPRGSGVRLVITDFGLAAVNRAAEADVHRLRASGVVGTPVYMAPEQARGETVTPAADIFALGVVMVEMLTGAFPSPPARPVPGLDRRWSRVILRCLAEKPGDRFATVEQIARVLDPDARRATLRRRLAVGGGGLAGLAAFAFAVATMRAQPPVCVGFEARLAGVWDEHRRGELLRAFEQTGKSYAATSARSTIAALDGYASRWVSERRDACAATRMRREQSEDLLDARMACYDDRLRELDAVARVLSSGDPAVLPTAVRAAQSLDPLERCGPRLARRRGRPPGPVAAASVAAVRDLLPRARALELAGLYVPARQLGDGAVAQARASGDPGLLVDGLTLAARIHRVTGEVAITEELLHQAADAAAQAGDEEQVADVFDELAFTAVNDRDTPLQARRLADYAAAVASRLGPEPRARHLEVLALLDARANKLDDAVARYRQVAELVGRRGSETEKAKVLVQLGNLLITQGKLDDATAVCESARDIYERAIGLKNPTSLAAIDCLARLYQAAARPADALPLRRTMLEIDEATSGADPDYLAGDWLTLGIVLYELGRPAEALECNHRARELAARDEVPFAPRSLALAEGRYLVDLGRAGEALPFLEETVIGDHDEVATAAKFALARALSDLGRDPARARILAGESLVESRQGPPTPEAQKLIAQIETWLAAHPR